MRDSTLMMLAHAKPSRTDSFNLVMTSPPYPNNYDYADATRLELAFFGEIKAGVSCRHYPSVSYSFVYATRS